MLSPSDAILATLLYFKQWNIPLTPADCLRFLPATASPATVAGLSSLAHSTPLEGTITSHQGFLVFKGAQQSVEYRHACYNASLTKWRVAAQTLKWVRWIPFLRMVAITNTLAMGTAKPQSDIDLLVIGKPGRLWTLRFLFTAVVQLMGRRRHSNLITDRLCLSFYVSQKALNFQPYFDVPHDLHYAYLVAMTTTIFEAKGSLAREEWEKANSWVRDYFPQHHWSELIPLFAVNDSRWTIGARNIFEWLFAGRLGDTLEKVVRFFQRKKIYAHPESRIHQQGTLVMVNDDVLKFHESNVREESRKQWVEECRQFGITV